MKKWIRMIGGAVLCMALFACIWFMGEKKAEIKSQVSFESLAAMVPMDLDEFVERVTETDTVQTTMAIPEETEASEPTDMAEEDTAEPESEPQNEQKEETASLVDPFEKYRRIYEKNRDFVGWISIEGTKIDYPVMQSPDAPNFYIDHGFDKKTSKYGVPYVQENCDVELSDNVIIYGHHMRNGSMFTDLCKYADAAFYKAHPVICFDTLAGSGRYAILAVFKTSANPGEGFAYHGFVNAESEDAYQKYVTLCKALSLYDTGVHAEPGEQLLTLSTCEYSLDNGRFVVVAKKISEE